MDTINPVSLRFRPAMERKFLDDYFDRSLIPARIGLVIGRLARFRVFMALPPSI